MTTKTDGEQLRADFEAWLKQSIYANDSETFHIDLWNAYQAALQSPEVQRLIDAAYERGLQDGRREGDDFIAGCLA